MTNAVMMMMFIPFHGVVHPLNPLILNNLKNSLAFQELMLREAVRPTSRTKVCRSELCSAPV
jgi:hypothetical protein